MSDFHYVRTLGADGGVDACSGPAIGLDLESVLADGLPPYKVALQIIAGLCEILDIADEDGEVHGDIDPKYVFIDDTGAVSLEAFGQTRSHAPEGRPKGAATDLYGLGRVAFRLFSFAPLPKLPHDDPDAHDDTVIDAILQLNFEGLNEEMVGDVQWFLAKLLSFDREERPPAVETWRTFIAYAEEARGPDFVQWCLDALDSGGERRTIDADLDETVRAEPMPDLKGPLVSQGPLAAGGLAFSSSGAAAGGTAFFTRDEMKAALDQGNPMDQRRPAPGGGHATNFWSRQQLAAMASEDSAAPRPKRAQGEGEKRKTLALSKQDVSASGRPRTVTSAVSKQALAAHRGVPAAPPPPEPSRDLPSGFGRKSEIAEQPEPTVRMNSNVVRTMTPGPAPQAFRPPHQGNQPEVDAAPPPSPAHHLPEIGSEEGDMLEEATVVQSPEQIAEAMAQERARVNASLAPAQAPALPPRAPPSIPQPAPPPAESGGSNMVLIVAAFLVVVIVLIFACAGLGSVSTFVAVFSGASTAQTVEAPKPAPALPSTVPDPEPSTAKPEPEPEPTTKPSPRPRPKPRPTSRPKPRPSPGPSPSPRPRPRPKPAPAPEPVAAPEPAAAAPPTGPVTLTLKTSDRGKLACPGVANKPFDGNTSLNIESYALPATCLVIIDGAKESFQVFNTGSVTCNKAGASVACSTRTVGR